MLYIWCWYNDAIYFQDQQVPIVGSNYTCLEAILIDSLKKDENYYPQIFLEECKYRIK